MRKTLLVLAVVAAGDVAAATAGDLIKAQGPRAIPGCYIVTLKPGAAMKPGSLQAGLTVAQVAVGAAARYRGQVRYWYEAALSGYSICLPDAAAELLARDPAVELVEQDQV